jgi:DNA-binding NarL/FixJ family response regulator
MPINHPSTAILFIDHHKEDRQYWARRLKTSSRDYVALEAETGKVGLAICQSQHIDCVVVELSLPDMSGFEVLINLVPHAHRPEMAVIVLTRVALHPMERLAMNNGAQAYLVKSHSSGDDLDRAIRKAIAVVGPNKNRQA